MYLDFFSLREFPFANGCDERFYFESDAHAEALANMLYTIRQRRGMVLITGEVGSGKTFLGSMLASRLGLDSTVIMIRHPPTSSRQLLRAALSGLGEKPPPDADKLALVEQMEIELDRLHRRQRTVALVVDEAQGLPDDVLEEVRMMWNWERDGQRLLQIGLIGQPELLSRLADPRWESLRQRIILSYHLGRLSARATAMYILHRRTTAAHDDCRLRFTLEAMKLIFRCTQGIPRLINSLCDNALLVAYGRGEHKITSEIVMTVVQDMGSWSLNGLPMQSTRLGEPCGLESAAGSEETDEGTYVPEDHAPLEADLPAGTLRIVRGSTDVA